LTEIPTSRNGRASSQTIGYSTSASSATGQAITNRMSHRMNVIDVALHRTSASSQ